MPPDDETVERAHRPALFQQPVDKVAPDEASPARNQVDPHLRCHHPCCAGDLMRSNATNFKLREHHLITAEFRNVPQKAGSAAVWGVGLNRSNIICPGRHESTKNQFVNSHRNAGDGMWILDFPSLILTIAAGLQLGLLGLFGWDAAAAIFGADTKAAYIVLGISAIWQLFRQRFH